MNRESHHPGLSGAHSAACRGEELFDIAFRQMNRALIAEVDDPMSINYLCW